MYTNHFYKRMNERVYNNKKRLNHKEYKRQKNNAKYLTRKALKNSIAEYKDKYGFKYVYTLINDKCLKYIFKGQKVLTVYEVNLDKEASKYELKYT